MILVRAPLRISFVGGGTDLPDFYRRSPGRVISASIDKFVYLVINPTPMIDKISARYSQTETVNSPNELQHPLIKAALTDLGIKSNLEIGSFASMPARVGLGSSSTFSVALLKGLYTLLGKKLNAEEVAEAAYRLEADLLKEPIGKQDQYAAAFGGFNVFQFNPDDSVEVKPVFLDSRNRALFEKHLLLFFIGITRKASSVLADQRGKIHQNLATYQEMADSVWEFREKLLAGDLRGLAEMLHQGWLRKKSLAENISSALIDELYGAGVGAGAWGGKILGAGGGGCLLFLAPFSRHKAISQTLKALTTCANLPEARQIPFRFVEVGTEILFNNFNHLS